MSFSICKLQIDDITVKTNTWNSRLTPTSSFRSADPAAGFTRQEQNDLERSEHGIRETLSCRTKNKDHMPSILSKTGWMLLHTNIKRKFWFNDSKKVNRYAFSMCNHHRWHTFSLCSVTFPVPLEQTSWRGLLYFPQGLHRQYLDHVHYHSRNLQRSIKRKCSKIY